MTNNWSQEPPDSFFAELEQALTARQGKRETGGEIKFLCPMHDDHNPSATYNTEKRVWHCFACGEGGGYVNLAGLVNVELPRSSTKELMASYTYVDEEGKPLFVVERWLDIAFFLFDLINFSEIPKDSLF